MFWLSPTDVLSPNARASDSRSAEMARPRCKRRAAALAKLAAFKEAFPGEPIPASLMTYEDDFGVRRYTVSGHDTRKSSERASQRYAAFTTRAHRNEIHLQLALSAANMICFDWDIVEDRVARLDPQTMDLTAGETFNNNFRAVLAAVHDEDRERFRADVGDALADPDGRFETEVRIRNCDGSTAWYIECGKVERDSQGRPARLIGVAIDVTVQKLAEQALKQARDPKD
ncbi:PAS domain-containing protein [Methylocystis parvus]|uniref:histidine kinase n=1 Tax=Methylocystis parvus TaxID=134 RepID=A0A6B8LVD6_9HYPH|nr:PAS domain-containing protein [Methylocystis parvus]